MRIFSFLILNLFFLFFIKNAYAYTFNLEVSSKYSDIFSTPILSIDDVNNYKKIINFQKDCEWKLANKYIFELKNKILIGHILAQRYLHPKCYRSQFLELSNWLKKYNDHPQAKRIYRLAIKRMPQGYKRPPAPSKPLGIKESNLGKKINKKYKSSLNLSNNQKIEKKRLLNSIKSRVNKGWPTGAAKLLKQRDIAILLDQVEIDQQKELIAKGYFLANHNDNPQINQLAIKYADEALENSSLYVPYAGWTAGLASWRLQRYKEAAKYFSNFSIALQEDEWHQASGSFWAARCYSELNEYDKINYWLKRAANNPNSFYGILAAKILAIDKPIDWSKKRLDTEIEVKIAALPAGKRIQALFQLGLINQLEKEIIKINSLMNKEVANWSLEIAQNFNLAFTQLKIVGKLSQYGIDIPIKFYYPIPPWIPKNGYKIDSSLIYAFMHQESRFNKDAKSRRGAVGLMQIMPSTAKFISKNKKVRRGNAEILKDPQVNIEVGQEYIEYLMEHNQVNRNLIYLTAAYNGGPGNLEKWKKNTNFLEDPLFFMESIPSRETRWFIEKVLTKYWIYKNQIGESANSLELLAKGSNPIY